MTTPVKVILEPDVIGPWLGLVGVIAGFGLSAGSTWLQGSRKERKEHDAALLNACSELNVATETVTTYAKILKGVATPTGGKNRRWRRSRPTPGPRPTAELLAWTQVMAAAVERVNIASDKVYHLAPRELGIQAMEVARDAFKAMYGDEAEAEQLRKAKNKFMETRMRLLGR